MNQRPFVHITDAGMAFLEKRPDDGHPHQANYEKKPVHFAIRPGLTIELHGEHFKISTKLTPDEALGLVMMLAYQLREQLPREPTAFFEASK